MVNLLKQSFFITAILACVLDNKKETMPEVSKLEDLLTNIEINDFKALFNEIRIFFHDFKPTFKAVNLLKSSKQSDWRLNKPLYLQEVFNNLSNFISNDNDEINEEKITYLSSKLIKKAKSFSTFIESANYKFENKIKDELSFNPSQILISNCYISSEQKLDMDQGRFSFC